MSKRVLLIGLLAVSVLAMWGSAAYAFNRINGIIIKHRSIEVDVTLCGDPLEDTLLTLLLELEVEIQCLNPTGKLVPGTPGHQTFPLTFEAFQVVPSSDFDPDNNNGGLCNNDNGNNATIRRTFTFDLASEEELKCKQKKFTKVPGSELVKSAEVTAKWCTDDNENNSCEDDERIEFVETVCTGSRDENGVPSEDTSCDAVEHVDGLEGVEPPPLPGAEGSTFSAYSGATSTFDLFNATVDGGLVGSAGLVQFRDAAINSGTGAGVRAGGNFSASGGGPYTIDGDLIANGNVTSPGGGANGCNIIGNVEAGGTLSLGNCTPDGTATGNVSPAPFTVPALPEAACDFTGFTGGSNISNGTRAPGDYGMMTINSGGTLTLSSGLYRVSAFTASSGTIVIDLTSEDSELGHNIMICIQGRLHGFSNDTKTVTVTSGTAANVYWEAHASNETHGWRNSAVHGTLYTPGHGGSIQIERGTHYSGALYAKGHVNIIIGTTLTFDPIAFPSAPTFP